jgi:hypothetical protein
MHRACLAHIPRCPNGQDLGALDVSITAWRGRFFTKRITKYAIRSSAPSLSKRRVSSVSKNSDFPGNSEGFLQKAPLAAIGRNHLKEHVEKLRVPCSANHTSMMSSAEIIAYYPGMYTTNKAPKLRKQIPPNRAANTRFIDRECECYKLLDCTTRQKSSKRIPVQPKALSDRAQRFAADCELLIPSPTRIHTSKALPLNPRPSTSNPDTSNKYFTHF